MLSGKWTFATTKPDGNLTAPSRGGKLSWESDRSKIEELAKAFPGSVVVDVVAFSKDPMKVFNEAKAEQHL